MPGKPTKREKKELARKARLEAQRRADRAATMRKIYAVVGVLVVGGGIAAAVVFGGKHPNDKKQIAKINTLAAAAGCTQSVGSALPDEGAGHVPTGQAVKYNTNPPTSGKHWLSTAPPIAPALTGDYDQPVQDEIQVHNLEHHHTVVQYLPSIDPAVKAAIDSVGKDGNYNTFFVAAPRPNMAPNQTLVLTAWDHMSVCEKPTTPDAVKAYVQAWADWFRVHAQPTSGEGFIPGTPQ